MQDFLIGLLLLVLCAAALGVPVACCLMFAKINMLDKQCRALSERLSALEKSSSASSAPGATPAAAPAAPECASSPAPEAKPIAKPAEEPKAGTFSQELAQLVLGHLFSFLGAVAVLVGVGVFLMLIADYLTPELKVALGYAASALVMGVGWRLQRQERLVNYAAVLQGLGLGIALVSTYCSCTMLEVMQRDTAFVVACLLLMLAYGMALKLQRTSMIFIGLVAGYINLFLFDDINTPFLAIYLLLLNLLNAVILARFSVFLVLGDLNVIFSMGLLVTWSSGHQGHDYYALILASLAALWTIHLICDGWRQRRHPGKCSVSAYLVAPAGVSALLLAPVVCHIFDELTYAGASRLLIPVLAVYAALIFITPAGNCLRRDYGNITLVLGWVVMHCLLAQLSASRGWPIAITLGWLAYAVALILGGILGRHQNATVGGVVAMLLAFARAFCVELGEMSSIGKVIIFLVLGGALLALSFWFNQRRNRCESCSDAQS